MTSMYHSLTKEHPWLEHLTSLSKRGVGALSSVAAFNHERAPMSSLPDALKVSNWTKMYIGANSGFKVKSLMAHNTLSL